MSQHRIRLAAATVALAATASLVTAAPPASATTEERVISLRGIEPRTGRFFIKGQVRPSYENRNAIIQRKVGRSGSWSTWKRFRTNSNSRYRERIMPLRRPGRVFYRVKINASGNYDTAYSGTIFIKTYRVRG